MDEPLAKGLYILSALDLITSSSNAEVAKAIRVDAGLPEKVSSLRDYPQRQLTRTTRAPKRPRSRPSTFARTDFGCGIAARFTLGISSA